MFGRAQGYTIVEWLVVLTIGLFLTAGVSSFFVAGQQTTHSTKQTGLMQENGRTALQLISRDLHQVGFWGDFTGNPLVTGTNLVVPTSPTADCIDNEGHGAFPNNTGRYRDIWSFRIPTLSGSLLMNCIDDQVSGTELIAGSDVLVIRRLGGEVVQPAAIDASKHYLMTNTHVAVLYPGTTSSPPTATEVPNGRSWEYINHVYYLDRETATSLPRLRRLTLQHDRMVLEPPLVEGVEQLHFLFGLDMNNDGLVDRYLPNQLVSGADWDMQRIVGVRIYVLVRALDESKDYRNDQQYNMGDRILTGGGDNYRRVLMSTSVAVNNLRILNQGAGG